MDFVERLKLLSETIKDYYHAISRVFAPESSESFFDSWALRVSCDALESLKVISPHSIHISYRLPKCRAYYIGQLIISYTLHFIIYMLPFNNNNSLS